MRKKICRIQWRKDNEVCRQMYLEYATDCVVEDKSAVEQVSERRCQTSCHYTALPESMLTELSIVIWCHLDTMPLEHSSWWRHMASWCLVIIGSGNGSSSARHQIPNKADTLTIRHQTILAKHYGVYNVYKIMKIKLRHRYFQLGNLIWKYETSSAKKQSCCSGKW